MLCGDKTGQNENKMKMQRKWNEMRWNIVCGVSLAPLTSHNDPSSAIDDRQEVTTTQKENPFLSAPPHPRSCLVRLSLSVSTSSFGSSSLFVFRLRILCIHLPLHLRHHLYIRTHAPTHFAPHRTAPCLYLPSSSSSLSAPPRSSFSYLTLTHTLSYFSSQYSLVHSSRSFHSTR